MKCAGVTEEQEELIPHFYFIRLWCQTNSIRPAIISIERVLYWAGVCPVLRRENINNIILPACGHNKKRKLVKGKNNATGQRRICQELRGDGSKLLQMGRAESQPVCKGPTLLLRRPSWHPELVNLRKYFKTRCNFYTFIYCIFKTHRKNSNEITKIFICVYIPSGIIQDSTEGHCTLVFHCVVNDL